MPSVARATALRSFFLSLSLEPGGCVCACVSRLNESIGEKKKKPKKSRNHPTKLSMNQLQRSRRLEEDVFYVLRAFSGRKFHQQQLVAASEPSVRSSGKKKCLVQLDADN